jgi:hypothetical protein
MSAPWLNRPRGYAQSAEPAPISRRIIALVDGFDVEGILKMAGELWKTSLEEAS